MSQQIINQYTYFNNKIIIPKSLRKSVLELLHETHLSPDKQKFLAKNIFYWPGINSDIINLTEDCMICNKFKRSQIKQNLLNHKIPNGPLIKIGMDITEYRDISYLIVIDYYSRCLEIKKINHKDAPTIISKLESLLCIFGIPLEIISDNMPFGSRQFYKFAKECDFEITTSSHYPKSMLEQRKKCYKKSEKRNMVQNFIY